MTWRDGTGQPARTVLEQKIRERRLSLREFVEFVETFAREHNEPGHAELPAPSTSHRWSPVGRRASWATAASNHQAS